MPLKSQFKLIISSLIVLLLTPILVYFFAGAEAKQFMRDFSGYFAALLSIIGIYLLMLNYIKQTELRTREANKQLNRCYFYIEKVKKLPNFSDLKTNKVSQLLVTDNFTYYEKDELMPFYQVNLVTEAKMIINLDIQIEYMDLSFVEKLYIARLDGKTQLFIPQRLNQTVDQTVYPVDLKTITLHYETLAGEVMRVVYEEQYKVLSCYGTDAQGEEIKLYSEYLEGTKLRRLN